MHELPERMANLQQADVARKKKRMEEATRKASQGDGGEKKSKKPLSKKEEAKRKKEKELEDLMGFGGFGFDIDEPVLFLTGLKITIETFSRCVLKS